MNVTASLNNQGLMETGGPAALAGTLVLDTVSPTRGLAGSYSIDFGQQGTGGTAATTSGGGTTMASPLGELIEVGTFVAPTCELCASPLGCSIDGGACPDGQVCESGVCSAAPVCNGAASCGACGIQSCPGGDCFGFDGLSAFCEFVFH